MHIKYNNAELVEITTKDKLNLPGILFAPKQKTKKALIYLHGNGSSSVFYFLETLAVQAQAFNRAGIAYLAFNNRGAHQYHKLYRHTKRGPERVLAGTAFELIKDCTTDIDAAVAALEARGYTELYLLGFSTGANKICVYNYYKPHNKIRKVILVGGGDDTGVYYKQLGKKKFLDLLGKSKQAVHQGRGKELVPYAAFPHVYSYQSLYDILNPDGDYNTFPYLEYLHKLQLSTKPLFRHFAAIKKPTLVIYGEKDEFAHGQASRVLEILQEKSAVPELYTGVVIAGAGHGFTTAVTKLTRTMVNWLVR